MPSPLAEKIAEIVDLAIQDPSGYYIWRDNILGEEWKILVDYEGTREVFQIRVKRRDVE